MVEQEVKNGVYRHFKGKFYQVLGVAHHSETLEEFVVYKALHETESNPDAHGELIVQPRYLFSKKVAVERDGERVLFPRFEYLESAEL